MVMSILLWYQIPPQQIAPMLIFAHSAMKNVLAAYRELHARKRRVIPGHPEPQQWRRWRELTRPRRFKTFESLPEVVQKKLLIARDIIRQYDAQAEVKLVGSWVHGGWADAQTSPEILELRQIIKGKSGLSDLDVLVESNVKLSLSAISAQAGFELSIIQGKLSGQKGILLPPTPKITLAGDLTQTYPGVASGLVQI